VASLTETLKDRLASYRQIKLRVIGRKSGRIEGGFSVRTKNVAATEIAVKFVKAVNAQDTDGLTTLMSSDHVFFDSLGNRFSASAMRSGWQGYFAMVPDYWIKVDQIVSEGDGVILFGSAGGTFVPKGEVMKPENQWQAPAVWRVLVESRRVAEWRVYCDNEPIREKMRTAVS
jgi:ketosteroid isomerase-like protein